MAVFDETKAVGTVGKITYPPTGHKVTYTAAGYGSQRRAASNAALARLKALVEAAPEPEGKP